MDQVAPVAPVPATPAPATPAPAEVVAPVVAQEPERTFKQAELDEIVERRLSKERRKREELERRLKVTEELALRRAELEKQPPAPKPQAEGEPTREQFGTYEEFIEARADYRARDAVKKEFTERDAKDREGKAKSEAEKAGEEFRRKAKESAKEMPDFDEVMADIKADDAVARIAADPIANCEAPGKILYHLAKNPDEAERIASLPLGQQAREIWKLEQTLASAKPPVKPSKAPEPIKPVGGKSAVGDEMPDAAKEPEKWTRWRNAQIAARKREGQRAA